MLWYPQSQVFLRDTNYQKTITKTLWRQTGSLIWFLNKTASVRAISHHSGVWSSRICMSWGQLLLYKFKACLGYRGGHSLKTKCLYLYVLEHESKIILKDTTGRCICQRREGLILRVPGMPVTIVTTFSGTKYNHSRQTKHDIIQYYVHVNYGLNKIWNTNVYLMLCYLLFSEIHVII